jgi:predicted house-cleaning noncanonical NTP pyrophosphatase (MazG superfamily)
MTVTPKYKLVRDLVPDSIASEGRTPNTRILEEPELIAELAKKLQEEAREITQVVTGSKDHLVEEIADIYEVLDNIIETKKLDKQKIQGIQEKKKREVGSFKKKIFLISVNEND